MTYDAEDIAALLREHPRLIAPSEVIGPRLRFRNAVPDDAEFILSLRLDERKNQHLSSVAPDLEKQRKWLEEMGDDQIYFIIEADVPVGTVRLYDQRGTSFSWGSWILSDHAPKSAAVESTLMVYAVGLELGFKAAHFDVRKANEKVWEYHERLGAARTGETESDYLYSIHKGALLELFKRYESRLKPPIEVIW